MNTLLQNQDQALTITLSLIELNSASNVETVPNSTQNVIRHSLSTLIPDSVSLQKIPNELNTKVINNLSNEKESILAQDT
jgi:hypothetical protein